jgi:hypothetical protein
MDRPTWKSQESSFKTEKSPIASILLKLDKALTLQGVAAPPSMMKKLIIYLNDSISNINKNIFWEVYCVATILLWQDQHSPSCEHKFL